MLNARDRCMCIVMCLGGGEDEINDSADCSFRVKSFIDGCLRCFSGWSSTLAVRAGVQLEEEEVAGEMSF